MKRRNEEHLINLAFGELSPHEAVSIEASLMAEPQSARELAALRLMKADMQRLNDVPEMQFSAERLRQAILARGLKKSNPWMRWSLVLAPGLAALLGIGLFLNRPTSAISTPADTQSPSVEKSSVDLAALTAPLKSNAFSIDTELTNPERAVRSEYSFGDENASAQPAAADSSAAAASTPAPALHHAFRVRTSTPSASSNTPNATPDEALASPDEAKSQKTFYANDIPAAVSDAAVNVHTPNEKMVIVEDSNDSNTGAKKATEVGSTTNVMVGG